MGGPDRESRVVDQLCNLAPVGLPLVIAAVMAVGTNRISQSLFAFWPPKLETNMAAPSEVGTDMSRRLRWTLAIVAGFAVTVLGDFAARIYGVEPPFPFVIGFLPGVLLFTWLRPK